MKYNLVIFAGGLGSRLENTEDRPKPLVDINGLTILSRIILSFHKTKVFGHYHILTCDQSDLFSKFLNKELPNIDFSIYTENKRSGRIGALRFFFESQNEIDSFFVCNGDTLFLNVNANVIKEAIKKFSYKPIIFLAEADTSRKDYKEIKIKIENKDLPFQNSGLFYISKRWFFDKLRENKKFSDIDDFLFDKKQPNLYSLLKTKILDGGTPARLSYIRGLIN
jgi:NDP-sugar pyrophosphorylase family protein